MPTEDFEVSWPVYREHMWETAWPVILGFAISIGSFVVCFIALILHPFNSWISEHLDIAWLGLSLLLAMATALPRLICVRLYNLLVRLRWFARIGRVTTWYKTRNLIQSQPFRFRIHSRLGGIRTVSFGTYTLDAGPSSHLLHDTISDKNWIILGCRPKWVENCDSECY